MSGSNYSMSIFIVGTKSSGQIKWRTAERTAVLVTGECGVVVVN